MKIIVVGAGISGLAAARRLITLSERRKLQADIEVLEASTRIGGTIGTEDRDGFLLERGPDCFITTKPRAKELCEELGLGGDLIPTQPEFRGSAIAWQDRLHPIPEGFYLLAPSKLGPMLRSPLLSWRGKLRLLAEPLIARRPQKDESLASFVRRRLGAEVLERLAQPLVGGIYGADPEALSLRSTFPRFLDLEAKSSLIRGLRSQPDTASALGARYSLFLTLRHGTSQLIAALSKAVGRHLELGAGVEAITPPSAEGSLWSLRMVDGSTKEAHALCLALPAPALVRLLSPIDRALGSLLEGIPCGDSVTAYFGFREKDANPLSGYGFVVPAAAGRTLAACTFTHRKFAGRAPQGHALFRAFATGKTATALLPLSDAEIAGRLLNDLRPLVGLKGQPLFTVVDRYRQALPQFHLGHDGRVTAIQHRVANLPRLELAGNWAKGVGLPDCIESGESAAEAIMSSVTAAS
jgi:oxygen-dependent protoporphyrinogen oxidase